MIICFVLQKNKKLAMREKEVVNGCYYNKDGDYMNEEEIRMILLCENIGELAYCGLLDKLDESNNNDLTELKKQAVQSLLSLYQQEKESHKLDNENYKILHDDVTALAKYMGLEENAIIDEMYEAFDKEKEKNKKLEEVINNLAKGVRYLGTNEELTTEDIIKMFSPEEIKIDFDEFMNRWEKKQHEESHLKDKIIDDFAEDLYRFNDQLETGRFFKVEDIKQYYFKKARGEENGQDNT